MSKYRIPDGYKNGFSLLINLSVEKQNELLTILQKSKPGLLPPALGNFISFELEWSIDDSFEIAKVIFSLYGLKNDESNKTIEILSDEFCNSLKTEFKDLDIEWDEFKNTLKSLMSFDDNIWLTFKALNLNSQYEKVFSECRILTDIRPLFYDKLEKKLNNAIISHNLKIEYSCTGNKDENIILTLTLDDLKKIKECITRAEKKEQGIKKSLKSNFNFIELKNE